MPSWAPITVQEVPAWRALVTAAARVASAAPTCWWAVGPSPGRRTPPRLVAGPGFGPCRESSGPRCRTRTAPRLRTGRSRSACTGAGGRGRRRNGRAARCQRVVDGPGWSRCRLLHWSGSFAGPVAGSVHEYLVAGVDEPIEKRLGYYRVGEQGVPVGRGPVGGQDQWPGLDGPLGDQLVQVVGLGRGQLPHGEVVQDQHGGAGVLP